MYDGIFLRTPQEYIAKSVNKDTVIVAAPRSAARGRPTISVTRQNLKRFKPRHRQNSRSHAAGDYHRYDNNTTIAYTDHIAGPNRLHAGANDGLPALFFMCPTNGESLGESGL